MKAIWRAAAFVGLWWACGLAWSKDDADTTEAPPQDESVVVVCLDGDGKPVAGAEVHFFQGISGKAGPYKYFGPFTSDAEGRASCPRAVFYYDQPGRFDRWAYARVPGRLVGVARSANWNKRSPVNPEFRVQLRPSTSVEGRVTVPDGFAPPQVTVRVRNLEVKTGPRPFDSQGFPRYLPFAGLDTALPEIFDKRPDADGRFRIDDVPVEGRLYLFTVGEGLGEAQWWNENKPFDAPIHLDVKKEGVLAGRVALPDDKPAAGMHAALRIANDPDRRFSHLSTFRTITDADGKFVIRGLPEARYVLSVEDRGGQWLFRPRERLLVMPGETLEVDVSMETGVAVSGRVFDSDGHPVEGAALSALADTQGAPGLAHVMTDHEGRYRLLVPSGRAQLYFNSLPEGFVYPRPQIVKRLDITAGQEAVEGLDFTIPRTEKERDAAPAASRRLAPVVAQPKEPNPALAKRIDAIAQQRAKREQAFEQELRAAKHDDRQVRDANARFWTDRRELAEDMMLLIAEHAAEAEAFDGVLVLVEEMHFPLDDSLTAIVLDHHLADPDMGRLCFTLRDYGGEAWAETVLKAAAESHPRRDVRGQAVFALGEYYRAEALPRGQETPEPKKSQLLAAARRHYQQTVDEFSDVRTSDGKTALGEKARHELARLKNLPDLKLGGRAPPIEAEALDGKPMSLAEHRGKVVLLVFWGSWCGPCMQMVPHERELVERHRGKPFVLLGVNCGDTRDVAKATMEKQQMTWRCWWDGEETRGLIETDYDVPHWPRVFVIDAEGVIRAIDPEADELDRTIETLLQAAAKQ
jgi:thiol-disulfide isomerase/thioredoxin/protocatechuate 3,4-dioxygenase beta subunit